jgi:hypothetical protein
VKPASINLSKLVLSPTGSINLGFILREDLLLCSSYLPLGVPNCVVIYTPSSNFSSAVAGEKEDFCKGSISLPIFYFVIVLLYFSFACIFLSKIQKNQFLYSCYFYLSSFSFARMGTPKNTKLCDFTSTNNNDFSCTPIRHLLLRQIFMRLNLLC